MNFALFLQPLHSQQTVDRAMTENLSMTSDPRKKGKGRALVSSTVILLALAGFLTVTVWLNIWVVSEQQFGLLAQSFLHGELAFRTMPGLSWGDTSPHNGHYYWPLGPFPAVVLVPFELVAAKFHTFFYQGYLQPLFVLAVLVIVYRIARVTGYGVEDAAYLGFGFGFATAFLGVAMWPWSWFFSQVITCLLVFAAIAEMITRRRPWVLGVLFALVLATRVTSALGVFWCVAVILSARDPWRKKLGSLVAIALPILAVAALLMVYNYVRFDNPFDSGYAEQLLVIPRLAETRALGVFSLRHIPGNLYFLLLAAPLPVFRNSSLALTFPYVVADGWGMNLWITSPCLLYLLGLRQRDGTSRLLLLTSLLILVPILLYYGVGGPHQFGYRYLLDFLPFLYYLLLRNYRQQRGDLTAGFKAVLLGSAVWNLYLFTGHFVWRVG